MIYISTHAEKRAKKRFKLSLFSLIDLFNEALNSDIEEIDVKGDRKKITHKHFSFIYVEFDNNFKLITITDYNNYKPVVERCSKLIYLKGKVINRRESTYKKRKGI